MRIFGTHAIREALHRKGSEGILYISADHRAKHEFTHIIKRSGSQVRLVYKSRRELAAMGTKQGALFVSEGEQGHSHGDLKEWLHNNSQQERLMVLVLDHVQDAQNLGAVFRSAAVFGAKLVISTLKRSAPENEYALKASSGTMGSVPSCKVTNIAEAIRMLKKHDIWTYALVMGGHSLVEYALPQRAAFVLGNEHKGVSPLVLRECDDKLAIPMFLPKNSTLDSLNVSVSAGIACYEYRRRYT